MDGSTAREPRSGDDAGVRARDRTRLLRRMATSGAAEEPSFRAGRDAAAEPARGGDDPFDRSPAESASGRGQRASHDASAHDAGRRGGRPAQAEPSGPRRSAWAASAGLGARPGPEPAHEPGRPWAATAGLRHTGRPKARRPQRSERPLGGVPERVEEADAAEREPFRAAEPPRPDAPPVPAPGRPWVATAGLRPPRPRR